MRLLVLDGNSILNRAFYGIKLLTTKDGHYTNALVGFLNIFQKLRDQTAPDRIAVAFDRKAPTFRHQMYGGYKAQRKGMPPELAEQLPILKELLSALGLAVVECEGYEADDILGTLSAQCGESVRLLQHPIAAALSVNPFHQAALRQQRHDFRDVLQRDTLAIRHILHGNISPVGILRQIDNHPQGITPSR